MIIERDILPAVEAHPAFAGFVRHDYAAARNYNGSACKLGERLVYAWRREDGTGTSAVWLGHLHPETLEVSSGRCILPATGETQWEDPRLFVAKSGAKSVLMLSVVRVCLTAGISAGATMELYKIDAKGNPTLIPLDHGKINQVEKNWTYLGGRPADAPAWAYWLNPLQIRTAEGKATTAANSFSWPLNIHGGTPAIPIARNQYLTIFHGSAPDADRHRRYYMAAMIFEWTGSACEVIAVSANPLLWASTNSLTIVCPRTRHYLPIVIFPAGLVAMGPDDYLISAGVNDSTDAIFRMKTSDLQLVPPDTLTGRHELPHNRMLYPGHVSVRVLGRAPIAEPGGPYNPGEIFNTTPQRAAALGPQVEIIREVQP
jgi:hypothetical protein